jgi:hypothetical protein
MTRGYAMLAVPLVAGVLAVVWWAPWSSSPDPVARAREAFGSRRVVHVVGRPSTPRSVSPLRTDMTVGEMEVWYDGVRDRIHTVEQHNGLTKTDRVGPAGPALTPLLAFVLRYRADLAGGRMRSARRDSVQKRPVIWLRSAEFRVAIDPVSYVPLWVEGAGGGPLTQLLVAETKPFDPADFLTAKQRKPRHL